MTAMLYRYGLATVVLAIAAAVLPSAPPLLAPAAIAAAQSSAASTASRAELDRGKVVYDEWCGACHDPGPRHPGTQALEALYKGKKPATLEERTDLLPKLTETFVRKGVSVMPPFRKTEISDRDLAALAAYLARPR
jgi:(+)-pinoresinol hydroxylase